MLTVAHYDAAEADAAKGKANRVLEAFRPEHFGRTGYPLSVTSDDELARYVDVMHELRHVSDYENILGGFTAHEFALFKDVSVAVADLTEKRFGRRMLPRGALVRAMIAYRHIRFLSEPADTTIFELGPGSGYLGALLALAGYRYAATDVTQPFYLYQSLLWRHLFGDRLIELAAEPRELSSFGTLPAGAVLHVPWWKYALAEPDGLNLEADVVACNHALCEMHRSALHYSVNLCGGWLSRPGRARFLFAEGMGSEIHNSRMDGYGALLNSGFLHVYRDPLIDVFMPSCHRDLVTASRDTRAPREKAPLPALEVSPPGPGAVGKAMWLMRPAVAARVARRALETIRRPGGVRALARRGVQFFAAPAPTGGRTPESWLGPLDLGTELDNAFFDKIDKGRAEIVGSERLPHAELEAWQRQVLGRDDLRTDDERFYQFCFGKDYYG